MLHELIFTLIAVVLLLTGIGFLASIAFAFSAVCFTAAGQEKAATIPAGCWCGVRVARFGLVLVAN